MIRMTLWSYTTLTDLASVPDVAELLGVSRAQVYRFIERDGLPALRLSNRVQRFRERDIEQWLENRAKVSVD
jgi:excisionase family DNA binding protein